MRLITLLFCLFLTNFAFATTYYLDYTGGSNANDGLSPATAWKDLFKIREVNSPGDVFLFKRGETWAGIRLYITESGTSSQPIRYGAYGTGGADPIITTVDTLANADDPLAWTEDSPGIWKMNLARTPGRLFLDNIEYLRANNTAEIGTTEAQGTINYWYYDTGVLYVYATQNPATRYTTIKGSQFAYTSQVERADHLVFTNLDFRGGYVASMAIIGGQHIEVAACALGHSGGSGAFVTEYNLDGTRRASSEIEFANNIFDSNFKFMYGPFSERGCGDGVRLRRAASNCIVRDNVFTNWAHNAVELLGDDATAAGVNNNLIYENSITAADIPYAHPLGADGVLGKCQYNEFYNNRAADCRTACQINGNNNWVHHNVMREMRQSPAKDDVTAYAFTLSVYGTDLVCQNNRYDHNLIYDTDEAGFLVRGYGYNQQVKDNIIRNNVVYNTGLDPYGEAYETGTGIVIYDVDNGVGGNTFQNNLFYNDAPGFSAVYLQDNNTYYSADGFNALNGQDGNTISNNLDVDPQITNIESGNYLPTDSSPLINAALNVGLAYDLAGNDRVYGTAPDIGPLETDVLVSLPVVWGDFTVRRTGQQNALLNWNTLSASQLKDFVIERSADVRNWENVGRVFPNVEQTYQFLDTEIATNSYYRIKQVDWDGQYSYSAIRYLTLAQNKVFRLQRLGNNRWQIQNDDLSEWSSVDATLYNVAGQPVLRVGGTFTFNTSYLPTSHYWLLIEYAAKRHILPLWVE